MNRYDHDRWHRDSASPGGGGCLATLILFVSVWFMAGVGSGAIDYTGCRITALEHGGGLMCRPQYGVWPALKFQGSEIRIEDGSWVNYDQWSHKQRAEQPK